MTLRENYADGERLHGTDVNAVTSAVNNHQAYIDNNPYNNVHDFGATGNGSTDDTTAINAALTAGGITYFPAGVYLHHGLSLPDGFHLEGVGRGYFPDWDSAPAAQRSILKLKNTSNTHSLTIGASRVAGTISNIEIDGNKANQSSGNGIHWTDAVSSDESGIVMINVEVHDAKGDGIYFGTARQGLTPFRVLVYACGGNGWNIVGTDMGAVKCASGGNTGHGVVLGGAVNRWVYGDVWSNTDGIRITGSNNNVEGCGIDNNNHNGIYVDTTARQVYIAGNNFAANGLATNNTYSDIDIHIDGTVTMVGNRFRNTGATNKRKYAINVNGGNAINIGSNHDAGGTVTAFSDQLEIGGTLVSQKIIDIHPESGGYTHLPYGINDLAYNNSRGGSTTITKNGSPVATSSGGTSLLYTPGSIGEELTGLANGDTVVITSTFRKAFRYVAHYGINFVAWSSPHSVMLEVWDDDASTWTNIYEVDGVNSTTHVGSDYGVVSGNEMTKLRVTMTDFPQSTLRVSSLWGVNYNSDMFAGPLQSKAGSLKHYYVDDFGANPFELDSGDPASEMDSDYAVQAAIDAMGTEPGVLVFGWGDYRLNSTKTLAYPGQGILGQGMHATRIEYMGTGVCFRVWDSTVPPAGDVSPGQGGSFTGFKLSGWFNPNDNVTGLKIGDLDYLKIHDVSIQGFWRTGDVGFWGYNRYAWSERAHVFMECSQNRTCILFKKDASHPLSHSSWDYSWWRLSVNTSGDQNGIKLSEGVDMVGVEMSVVGNTTGNPLPFSGISGNTGVYFTVGTNDSDPSIFQGKLQMEVETSGAATPEDEHYDINVDDTARLYAPGASIVFTSYGAKPYRAGTAARWTCRVDGRISCPSLGSVGYSQSSRSYGTIAGTQGTNYDFSGSRYFDLSSGNEFYYILPNGATTFVWDVNSLAAMASGAGAGAGQAASYIFSLQQPGSGAAGTVTWPGSVYWAAGAPLLRTANTDTDIILLYTHEHTTFFGVHLNAFSVVAVPSTATSTGIRGQQAFDSSWHYICTATNTWRRVAIATW